MNLTSEQLKAIDLLHEAGIWKQDILSLLFDLRKAIRFHKRELPLEVLPILSLNYLIVKEYHIGKDTIIIGKNLQYLEKFKDEIENSIAGKEIGKFLGYPNCCIKSHAASTLPAPNNILPWKLNYLFNMDTRVKDETMIAKLVRNRYKGWNKYLIPHIPCSFSCIDSIQYAEKLYEILEQFYPDYAHETRSYLKNQILYHDDFRFIVFENDNTIKVLKVNNLVPPQILQSFDGSDDFEIKRGELIIRSGSNKKTIRTQVTLYNFL